MLTVIDVGCATHGSDSSIEFLQEQYQPDTLIGLDPLATAGTFTIATTRVTVFKAAAWTHTGAVEFHEEGTRSRARLGSPRVPCYDLAELIEIHSAGDVILKMDAEGAEYVLLPYLVEKDVDLMVKLALIEWHCPDCGVGGGHRPWCDHVYTPEPVLRCEVKGWER